MALAPVPSSMLFPPLRTTAELKQSLTPGQGLVVFHAAGGNLFGFLVSRQTEHVWLIGETQLMQKARGLVATAGQLQREPRNGGRGTLERRVARRGRPDVSVLFAKGADRSGRKRRTWRSCRIAGCGICRSSAGADGWRQGCFQGRAGGGDVDRAGADALRPDGGTGGGGSAGVSSDAAHGNRGERTGGGRSEGGRRECVAHGARECGAWSTAVGAAAGQPGFVLAPLLDQLVVLDEIDLNRNDALAWSPLPRSRGKNADSLAAWMGLPFEGPERLVITGLPTAAETGLKVSRRGDAGTAAPGSEMFQSVCALMASGARTVLVSRWRTGGQMNLQLVAEFVQELQHSPADVAWQRSILLAQETPLDAEQEPRLKRLADGVEPPGADHPFFWAGYLLVDTGTRPGEEAAGDMEEDAQPQAAGEAGAAGKAAEIKPDQTARVCRRRCRRRVNSGRGWRSRQRRWRRSRRLNRGRGGCR